MSICYALLRHTLLKRGAVTHLLTSHIFLFPDSGFAVHPTPIITNIATWLIGTVIIAVGTCQIVIVFIDLNLRPLRLASTVIDVLQVAATGESTFI